MSDLPHPPPVIEQLAMCGVQSSEIRLEFDELLQTTVVHIKAGTNIKTPTFPCIRHATWGDAELDFEDEGLGEAYRQFDNYVSAAEGKASARAWLSEQGLLESLPEFQDGETAEVFLEKVEHHCSLGSSKALKLVTPSFATIRQDFITFPTPPEFECLINTLMAVDLEKAGLSFGFIGNERYGDEQDENAQKN